MQIQKQESAVSMKSTNNKFITHADAVPIIESNIFLGREDQRFALGVLSSEAVLSYQPNSVEEAYLKLRANVYIDQTGILHQHAKRHDGTELDKEDHHSTHFVVLENLIGRTTLFACMRLIEKIAHSDTNLPIEDFFSNGLTVRPTHNSTEVSRFIVRHNDRKQALTAKMKLMTASLAYSYKNNLGPIFGVVETNFERDLRIMKVPIHRIAEPKLINKYNSHNIGIIIDKEAAKNILGESTVNELSMPIGSFHYWGNL